MISTKGCHREGGPEAGTKGKESPELKLYRDDLCELSAVCSFPPFRGLSAIKCLPLQKLCGLGENKNIFC